MGSPSRQDVKTSGTARLVHTGVRKGHSKRTEARDIVDEMMDAGWYCSTSRYAKIGRNLKSIG